MSIACCERVNYWVIESWRSQKVGGQIEKERQRSRGKFSIVTTIQSERERGGGNRFYRPKAAGAFSHLCSPKALLSHYLVISASIYTLPPAPSHFWLISTHPSFSLIWTFLFVFVSAFLQLFMQNDSFLGEINFKYVWKRRVKGGEETERGVRVWNGSEFHLHTATANLHYVLHSVGIPVSVHCFALLDSFVLIFELVPFIFSSKRVFPFCHCQLRISTAAWFDDGRAIGCTEFAGKWQENFGGNEQCTGLTDNSTNCSQRGND